MFHYATDSAANTYSSFDSFTNHMKTNAIGPIMTAQKLLQTRIPIGTMTFMSSDSGSATTFRAFEDGYACSYKVKSYHANATKALPPMLPQKPRSIRCSGSVATN